MKLFVGNMSWSMTEADLHNEFAPFGNIEECRLITDRETGRSRGFGFVTYAEKEQAESAIEAMNGKEIAGRNLKVNEAIDRPRRQNNNRW